MLELNASAFYEASARLNDVVTWIETEKEKQENEPVNDVDRSFLR